MQVRRLRSGSFTELEENKVIIDTAHDFLKWYNEVECCIEHDQFSTYRDFMENLKSADDSCHTLVSEIDTAIKCLLNLLTAHETVSSKCSSLHQVCEQSLSEQKQMCDALSMLQERMEYFQALELMAQEFKSHLSVQSDKFISLLKKLDDCVDYMKTHKAFKESSTYQSQFEAYLYGGLSLIRNFVMNNLTEIGDQIYPNVAPTGRRLVGGGAPAAENSNGITFNQAYPFLYARFQVPAAKLKMLVVEIEKRTSGFEYAP
jgi:hypothetical protein